MIALTLFLTLISFATGVLIFSGNDWMGVSVLLVSFYITDNIFIKG